MAQTVAITTMYMYEANFCMSEYPTRHIENVGN